MHAAKLPLTRALNIASGAALAAALVGLACALVVIALPRAIEEILVRLNPVPERR